MKIAILDDDDGERRQLVTLVQSYLYEHHDEAFEVVDFADEASFRADFSVRPANIAFLDIYLDGEPRGIKIAYDIQREAPDCLLLFITMSPEFALDGFAVKAVHYCIKPVTAAAVAECFARCWEKMAQDGRQLALRDGYETVSVPIQSVEVIESRDHVVFVYLQGRELPLEMRQSLAMVEQELSDPRFLRTNRSYIINMDLVEQLSDAAFIMQSGRQVPMRRQDKLLLRSKYKAYIFDRMRHL